MYEQTGKILGEIENNKLKVEYKIDGSILNVSFSIFV